MSSLEEMQYDSDYRLYGREMAEHLKQSDRYATSFERQSDVMESSELAIRVERANRLAKIAIKELISD